VRRSAVAAVLLPFAFAACSDLADLSGGESDAASDASAPDSTAGADADASVEAAPDANTCGHAFCDDFETGDLGARWVKTAVASGELTFDSMRSRSGSRSLRAAVASTAPFGAHAALQQSFAGPVTHFSCGGFVFVDSLPPTGYPILAIHLVPPAYDGQSVAVFAASAATDFARFDVVDGGNDSAHTSATALSIGKWVDVRIDVHVAPPSSATLLFDGIAVGTIDLPAPVDTAPNPTFELGLGTCPTGEGITVYYDDAYCDLVP